MGMLSKSKRTAIYTRECTLMANSMGKDAKFTRMEVITLVSLSMECVKAKVNKFTLMVTNMKENGMKT